MKHHPRQLNPLSQLSEGTLKGVSQKVQGGPSVSYFFDDQGRFVIENFQQARPFSSFLPGIAGLKGTPLWLFYVNRGQGVASFGTRDKDGAILEFFPANKAYQQVAFTGFRTFIKEQDSPQNPLYEPFSAALPPGAVSRLYVQAHEFEIEEENHREGWKTNVVYFTLPHEPFAALVRKVTLRNLSDKTRRFELIDGLPSLLPSGLINSYYKEFGHTLQSWMDVYNLEEGVPFYKLRASFVDDAEVSGVQNGNFFLSGLRQGSQTHLLRPLVDPQLVFGQNNSLAYPEAFARDPLVNLLRQTQRTVNQVPCGFSGGEFELEPGGELSIVSMIGHAGDIHAINRRKEVLVHPRFIEEARRQNRKLIEDLCSTLQCRTAFPRLDAYARQTYLDNLLRGGEPVFLGKDSPKTYHVFSRRHGDLERDYNFFTLLPEYYSQGNGGYRDVNQNRRMDAWFHPQVKDFNLRLFVSLIQTDGYNPFVVQGSRFTLAPDRLPVLLAGLESASQKKLSDFFKKPFTPGRLLAFLEAETIKPAPEMDSFFQKTLSLSQQSFEAEFKEGYWTDHWVYNLDLLENVLSLYPDQEEELLLGGKKYRYFDSPEVVKPRSEKYVLAGETVRQLGAVQKDSEKQALLEGRQEDPHWMRSQQGRGPVYETTLYAKMANLAAVKFATLDPLGIGIEMEADKPGWNDSLNGLPSLFASSIPETCELKRLLEYLLEASNQFTDRKVQLPLEVLRLLQKLQQHLFSFQNSPGENRDYLFWDGIAAERENYRSLTRLGFSGEEREMTLKDLVPLWSGFLGKVQAGLEKAAEMAGGLLPTYLCYEPSGHEILRDAQGTPRKTEKGQALVKVLGWKPKLLPFFLESAAKALKDLDDPGQARALYRKVKASGLYDAKLKMYKVCESLESQPGAIGRGRSFTPGWLENESIFLHMEYKYLLSMLKAGLYEEFFTDIQTMWVPFLKPEVYGRSPLENSSFLVSSANSDETLHGAGFSARLSGSSAEFLEMWTLMMAGHRPFTVQGGSLELRLSPILPGWLFDGDGRITFRLFGTCDVTYHNPSRKDSFGGGKDLIEKMTLEDQNRAKLEIEGGVLKGGLAAAVREGQILRMDVYFKP